ncbi:acyl transferase/acyl hydrolase/lysophospholipase superfamily protein isoform X1 [Tasmannia lanceolata]|uniref:acyl transferase/acyl hydrolase/lysophospholipase superfamily protein isoform X1 n=1 Tax=Tasmannia lanceolata TaxID=3420 RepID=UPI00406455E6
MPLKLSNKSFSPAFFLMSSLSPLTLSAFKFPHNPNPNPKFLHSQTHSFRISAKTQQKDSTTDPPLSDKKSFAVATGEFFLGVASLLLKNRNPNEASLVSNPFTTSRDTVNLDPGLKFTDRRVVEDPEDPVVLWEQDPKDVEAERDRKIVTSPGFSFSAAGLLLPYHLGVAQFLIENGYIKETTPLSGSSAGAIACAVIASGHSMQYALEATKVLAEDCRVKGTAFRLGAVLKDALERLLPDDIHARSSGRVRVAITQILWRPMGLLVDQFESKEDLINALVTSSFIPGYLAPRPATIFRNKLCIDGGLTLFMPPTSASETVRVCAFPGGVQWGLKGIGISPDCNPENRATARQLLNWALEPAEDHILDELYELGYLDASVWAEQKPVEATVQTDRVTDNP